MILKPSLSLSFSLSLSLSLSEICVYSATATLRHSRFLKSPEVIIEAILCIDFWILETRWLLYKVSKCPEVASSIVQKSFGAAHLVNSFNPINFWVWYIWVWVILWFTKWTIKSSNTKNHQPCPPEPRMVVSPQTTWCFFWSPASNSAETIHPQNLIMELEPQQRHILNNILW